ncbi:hypothetical protein [Cyanobacterium aponinum]|uniref:hypothetical protein n=1 Tax=Cyanobacterium aponinum TaxID=379064 RepID=UPI000C12B611|nr:hypothetical protein [Cyanobacterium aponinum]PHV64209.1 hypothetical protein CSQ80_01550 [Cyanobacterium aponinum IPPAS B-1201]
MESKVFVHAGWNKTATTFLQKKIFAPLLGDGLVGPNRTFNDLQKKSISDDMPLLISDESLLGLTIMKRTHCRNLQRFNFLQNWAKICPNSQFIICVRNHKNFLESLYRQFLHLGGDLEPRKFLDVINNKGFIKKEELFYEPILSKLHDLFPNRHFIYDYSLFQSKPEYVLKELFKFLGLNYKNLKTIRNQNRNNQSVGYYQAIVLRNINKVVCSPLNKKPLPLFIFKACTFGKTPRQICQNVNFAFLKTDKFLTNMIYEPINEDLVNDWTIISRRYINVR